MPGSSVFHYDSTKLVVLVSAISTIELDAAQERLVKDITDVVASRIGMDPIPCRGLWLRAIKEWQLETGKLASTISALPPAERAAAAVTIKQRFLEFALEMLVRAEQRTALAEAIEDAFALYLRKYNRRPADG